MDYRAAARASMRPRLTVPSYWFWWMLLRVPGIRVVERMEKVWFDHV